MMVRCRRGRCGPNDQQSTSPRPRPLPEEALWADVRSSFAGSRRRVRHRPTRLKLLPPPCAWERCAVAEHVSPVSRPRARPAAQAPSRRLPAESAVRQGAPVWAAHSAALPRPASLARLVLLPAGERLHPGQRPAGDSFRLGPLPVVSDYRSAQAGRRPS